MRFRVYLPEYKRMIYPHIDEFVRNGDGYVIGMVYPKIHNNEFMFAMNRCNPNSKTEFGSQWGQPIIPEQRIMLSYARYDIHGVEIYDQDVVSCYQWFDGLSDKPKQKSRIVVSHKVTSNIDDEYSGGMDGWLLHKSVVVLGNTLEHPSLSPQEKRS